MVAIITTNSLVDVAMAFRYSINEKILFEVGMRSEIERFVEGMIVTIQMWITPISYSSRSAAVIAQAIEVGSKPFKSILPFEVSITCTCMNKLHCIPCLLFVLKIIRVINFCGFHYPRKFFNNEIFPDYSNSNDTNFHQPRLRRVKLRSNLA